MWPITFSANKLKHVNFVFGYNVKSLQNEKK